MRRQHRVVAMCVLLATVLYGCGGANATPRTSDGGGGETTPTAPKHIVLGIVGSDPPSLNTVAGSFDSIEELVSAGLTRFDDRGALQPDLAEQVPTLENGLWKFFPDGRMETTWKLRPGASWHDGTPLTTADLQFTAELGQDKELAAFRNVGYDSMESIEAVDPRTITVKWKQPYIDADIMFTWGRGSTQFALPLPKHILETPYRQNKAALLEQRFWTTEFIGSGPFKLREWERDSHLILEANAQYVLGRPKIDVIEVKFVNDRNTLVANVLAGAVDLTTNNSVVTVGDVPALESQWKDGRIDMRFSSWIVMFPQFVNPTPAVVGDVRFRRALLYALDRQQLSDNFMSGLAPIAHAHIGPNDPAYKDVEPSIVKYGFEPRTALQLITELGYTRGSDGMFRDGAGQPLSVEVRAAPGVEEEKFAYAATEFWKQVGVATTLDISSQRRTEEDNAAFKSFSIQRYNYWLQRLPELHSSQLPTPENRFSGKDRPRYSNPEFDALLGRFIATTTVQERYQVAGQLLHHLSDQLVQIGTVYNAETTMINNRLQNIVGRTQVSETYGSYLWEVK